MSAPTKAGGSEIAATPMPELSQVLIGDLLWGRDAHGDWLPMIARSEIERADWNNNGRRHDFAGAYVAKEGSDDPEGIYWPLEDLRFRAPVAGGVR